MGALSPEPSRKAGRLSLHDGVVLQGAKFDGFEHVDEWISQRLVTATGPNALTR